MSRPRGKGRPVSTASDSVTPAFPEQLAGAENGVTGLASDFVIQVPWPRQLADQHPVAPTRLSHARTRAEPARAARRSDAAEDAESLVPRHEVAVLRRTTSTRNDPGRPRVPQRCVQPATPAAAPVRRVSPRNLAAFSRRYAHHVGRVARSGNDSPDSAPRSGSASPSPISGHPDLATAGSLAAGRTVARRAGVRHAGEVLHTDLSAALATAEALAHEARPAACRCANAPR